jgi:molecular chaperone DnaK
MSEDVVLGIDLGTTFSAMAIVDRFGKPVIVPNADGHATTPSVIHFYDRDACVVGEEAVKMVVVDPTNVVRFIKRSMGEPGFTLEFFGRSYSPQELSAIILRKFKEDAEEALGHPVTDCVITVPAYFNAAQRGATAEAGAIAGFNVLSIINEPTTAAISYGIERLGGSRRLLVFDLGGGTFDVTLMEISGISFRTIASDGNAELGGKDWDDRLVNYVAEQFMDRFGMDPRDEPQPYQELYERCLHAKISLSTKPRAVIPVNFRGHRMVVGVTREEFERISRDLVEQCADTCALVLDKAAAKWSDMDEILLVGGSTRMPMIQEMLRRLSGKHEVEGVNPDECVALGAALAGVLRHRPKHPALLAHRQALARRAREGAQPARATTGSPTPEASPADQAPPKEGLAPVQITDVTSHPLGIVVLDRNLNERVVTLIRQATPVPCEKHGRFAYAYDNMTAVRVEITEGYGRTRDEVEIIGEVVLENLPPRPRGTPIDVVYRYNVNQILEVDVVDVETRAIRKARIDLKGGLVGERMDEARRNIARASIT